MTATTARFVQIDLRIAPDAKRALQEAAREKHISLNQFVIESAMATAREVLAERHRIGLSSTDWTAFMAALDAPPRNHPRMKCLLRDIRKKRT